VEPLCIRLLRRRRCDRRRLVAAHRKTAGSDLACATGQHCPAVDLRDSESRTDAVMRTRVVAWHPSAILFGYQWLLDEMSVVRATGPSYVVQNSDQGDMLRREVKAASVAGHTSAVSAGVVVPVGESGDFESVRGVASVGVPQMRAMLNGWLTRSGNIAKIAALLKVGALSVPFHALRAGTVVVDWYKGPLSI
jgi:hypothetical protein